MMARIKIDDLPVVEEMKDEELKGIFGGNAINEGGGLWNSVKGGLRFSRVVAPEDSDIDIPMTRRLGYR